MKSRKTAESQPINEPISQDQIHDVISGTIQRVRDFVHYDKAVQAMGGCDNEELRSLFIEEVSQTGAYLVQCAQMSGLEIVLPSSTPFGREEDAVLLAFASVHEDGRLGALFEGLQKYHTITLDEDAALSLSYEPVGKTPV